MIDKKQIGELISAAIENYNQAAPSERQVVNSPSTILFGDGSKLDSLGFINLIVAIETEIENTLDLSIFIVDERALGMEENPFRTLQTLQHLVEERVEEMSAN
jgi:acyl carrier protein